MRGSALASIVVGLVMVVTARTAGALELTQRWEELSPHQREQVERNVEEFRRLPPEEQEERRRALERWKQMSEEERSRKRTIHRQFLERPRDEQREIRERLRGLGR